MTARSGWVLRPSRHFRCGPASMVCNLQAGLRQAGVVGRHIPREYFDWRRAGRRPGQTKVVHDPGAGR